MQPTHWELPCGMGCTATHAKQFSKHEEQSYSSWNLSSFTSQYVLQARLCSAGVITRHKNPNQPCAFVATNHILLVWLVRRLGCEQHLLISPNKIIYVLVAADLTTFVAQLMGVSILVSSKDYVVWVASVWVSSSRHYIAYLICGLIGGRFDGGYCCRFPLAAWSASFFCSRCLLEYTSTFSIGYTH